MSFGLSRKAFGQITAVFKKFPNINTAALFGSRAMGTHKPSSDVDIALKGEITLSILAKVKAYLEEETPLPYTFDVVDYDTIENPAFRQHIDKYGILIYKKSSGFKRENY